MMTYQGNAGMVRVVIGFLCSALLAAADPGDRLKGEFEM